jgi:hypothetical protein
VWGDTFIGGEALNSVPGFITNFHKVNEDCSIYLGKEPD